MTHYTTQRLFRELLEVTIGERGFLYTLRQVTFLPKTTLAKILSGEQGRLNDPIRFVVLCVALTVLAMSFANLKMPDQDSWTINTMKSKETEARLEAIRKELTVETDNSDLKFRTSRALESLNTSREQAFVSQFSSWLNAMLLIAVPIYALFTWLIFRRDKNFSEHLVLNAYIYGVQCLMAVLTLPLNIWGYWEYTTVYFLVATVYQLFAWQQVLEIRTLVDWILAGILLGASLFVYFVVSIVFVIVLGVAWGFLN